MEWVVQTVMTNIAIIIAGNFAIFIFMTLNCLVFPSLITSLSRIPYTEDMYSLNTVGRFLGCTDSVVAKMGRPFRTAELDLLCDYNNYVIDATSPLHVKGWLHSQLMW